jgi:hypothetical protein
MNELVVVGVGDVTPGIENFAMHTTGPARPSVCTWSHAISKSRQAGRWVDEFHAN